MVLIIFMLVNKTWKFSYCNLPRHWGGINLAPFVPSIFNWHGWAGPREKVTQSCNWNCWIRQKNNRRIRQSTYLCTISRHDTRWRVTATPPQAVHSQFQIPCPSNTAACFGDPHKGEATILTAAANADLINFQGWFWTPALERGVISG